MHVYIQAAPCTLRYYELWLVHVYSLNIWPPLEIRKSHDSLAEPSTYTNHGLYIAGLCVKIRESILIWSHKKESGRNVNLKYIFERWIKEQVMQRRQKTKK